MNEATEGRCLICGAADSERQTTCLARTRCGVDCPGEPSMEPEPIATSVVLALGTNLDTLMAERRRRFAVGAGARHSHSAECGCAEGQRLREARRWRTRVAFAEIARFEAERDRLRTVADFAVTFSGWEEDAAEAAAMRDAVTEAHRSLTYAGWGDWGAMQRAAGLLAPFVDEVDDG